MDTAYRPAFVPASESRWGWRREAKTCPENKPSGPVEMAQKIVEYL